MILSLRSLRAFLLINSTLLFISTYQYNMIVLYSTSYYISKSTSGNIGNIPSSTPSYWSVYP